MILLLIMIARTLKAMPIRSRNMRLKEVVLVATPMPNIDSRNKI